MVKFALFDKSTQRKLLMYYIHEYPPRKKEEYYAYGLRVGGQLCLLIGVPSLSLLRSRYNNPPPGLVQPMGGGHSNLKSEGGDLSSLILRMLASKGSTLHLISFTLMKLGSW